MSFFGILVCLVDFFTYLLATFAICNFLSLKMSTGVRWWDKGGGREAYLGITSSRPHKHHHHTQIDLNSHRFLTKILNSSRFPTKLSQPAAFEQLLPRKKSPNIHLAPHLRGRTLNKKPPLKSPKWERHFTKQKIKWSNQVELVTWNRGRTWNLNF